MFKFLILFLFLALPARAAEEDLVLILDGEGFIINIIDCSDTEDNDGCYEWDECCFGDEGWEQAPDCENPADCNIEE